MSEDPVRLIHAIDPPAHLVALVRDLDGPPPVPPDLRAAMRARLPATPSAPPIPWRGPTLAVAAAAVGGAIVWSIVTTAPQAPPVIRPEPSPPVPLPVPEPPTAEAPPEEAPAPVAETPTRPAAALEAPAAPVTRPPAAPPIPDRPSPEDIRRVVAQNRRALSRCYEDHGGGEALRLTVRLTVAPDGTTHAVTIDGAPSPLGGCVATQVRRWRFPASREGATVSYPIVFRSEAGPAPGPPASSRRGAWWSTGSSEDAPVVPGYRDTPY